MLGYISFSRLFLDFPRQPHDSMNDSWAYFPLFFKNHTPQWQKWELRFLNQLKSTDGWMCKTWSNKWTHTNASMKNAVFCPNKTWSGWKWKINHFQSDSVTIKRGIYPCSPQFYWTVTKRPSKYSPRCVQNLIRNRRSVEIRLCGNKCANPIRYKYDQSRYMMFPYAHIHVSRINHTFHKNQFW